MVKKKGGDSHIDIRNLPEMLAHLRAQPAFLIRRSQQILATFFTEDCKKYKSQLTQLQLEALCAISDQPGLKQITLAKRLGVDRSTATVLIDNLSAMQLVVRKSVKDRRQHSLQLTRKAAKVLKNTFAAAKESAVKLLAPLGLADEKELTQLLTAMASLHHLPAPKWEPLMLEANAKPIDPAPFELTKLYAMPAFLLDRCSQIGTACLLEATKSYGLSSGQAGTLFAIAMVGPIDQGGLRRTVGADRSSVSVIVPMLVKKGLVAKEKDIFDRRRTLVRCTQAGFDLIDEAQPSVEHAAQRCFEGLKANTRQRLCEILSRLVAAHEDFH